MKTHATHLFEIADGVRVCATAAAENLSTHALQLADEIRKGQAEPESLRAVSDDLIQVQRLLEQAKTFTQAAHFLG